MYTVERAARTAAGDWQYELPINCDSKDAAVTTVNELLDFPRIAFVRVSRGEQSILFDNVDTPFPSNRS